jgi:hypothetical protein
MLVWYHAVGAPTSDPKGGQGYTSDAEFHRAVSILDCAAILRGCHGRRPIEGTGMG